MSDAEFILKIIQENSSCEAIGPLSKFSEISITSIEFIKIVVEIEVKYNIEFEDEYLVMQRFDTIDDLIKYVNEKILNLSL